MAVGSFLFLNKRHHHHNKHTHTHRLVVSRSTCPPISPPPRKQLCTTSCSNKHTQPLGVVRMGARHADGRLGGLWSRHALKEGKRPKGHRVYFIIYLTEFVSRRSRTHNGQRRLSSLLWNRFFQTCVQVTRKTIEGGHRTGQARSENYLLILMSRWNPSTHTHE
jgi:hypothetical protein